MSLASATAVTRRFADVTAVDAVDLEVGPGEVVGLLGANGAGKTTLLRMLLGLLAPTSGEVALFGERPSRRTRRRLGYVPQTLGLYVDLTVRENWRFTAAAFGARPPALPEELADVGDDLVGDLSLGVQRRVAFAVALAHRPELLVLDEPTSGVGPLSRARLWRDVRDGAEAGIGVLVTTHHMAEAEQCDRLVVMVDGRVAVAGSVASVIAGRTVCEVDGDDWRVAYAVLDDADYDLSLAGTRLRVSAPVADVAAALARRGITAPCASVAATLEEAFVQIVRAGGASAPVAEDPA